MILEEQGRELQKYNDAVRQTSSLVHQTPNIKPHLFLYLIFRCWCCIDEGIREDASWKYRSVKPEQ